MYRYGFHQLIPASGARMEPPTVEFSLGVLPVPVSAYASRLKLKANIAPALLLCEFLEGDHGQLTARQGIGIEPEFARLALVLPRAYNFDCSVNLLCCWLRCHDFAQSFVISGIARRYFPADVLTVAFWQYIMSMVSSVFG